MFDAPLFLKEQLRTPQAVLTLFAYLPDEAPKLGTVEKWFQRGVVPSSWLPLILALLEIEHGQPVSLCKYLNAGVIPANDDGETSCALPLPTSVNASSSKGIFAEVGVGQ